MAGYCFSTPMPYIDPKGKCNPSVLAVYIAPKNNGEERSEFTDKEYLALAEIGIYDFLVEVEEQFFESFDSNLSSKGLALRLVGMGMSHNSSLDKILEEWIAEKQKSGIRRNNSAFLPGKSPNPGFNPDFKNK